MPALLEEFDIGVPVTDDFRDLEAAMGHPETLLCELRFLFLWPEPSQPGVGQHEGLSGATTTFGASRSRLGHPDRLLWCA